ncbi:MAG: hypothetical protein LIO68_02985 [Rikenellaceae bacterium]|nr:hypothetical protein [Rikenellaceae bacterium]
MNPIMSNETFWFSLAGIVISFFGVILPLYQFIANKRIQQKDTRFRTYHRLVKELVQPDEESKSTWTDRQMAVAFELRNFPYYYALTERVLNGLKEAWEGSDKRLLNEMDYTLLYISYYKKWYQIVLRSIGLKRLSGQLTSYLTQRSVKS